MDETVGNGGCGGCIVEEFAPVLKGQIGRHHCGGPLVATVEDLVQQVGAASVEAEVAESSTTKSWGTDHRANRRWRALRAWAATRSLTKSAAVVKRTRVPRKQAIWAMALARWVLPTPDGPTKTTLARSLMKSRPACAQNEILVDALGEIEVECVEGGERKDGRALDGHLGSALGLHAQLLAHEVVDQPHGRIIARDGLATGGVEVGRSVVEAEVAQDILQGKGLW